MKYVLFFNMKDKYGVFKKKKRVKTSFFGNPYASV